MTLNWRWIVWACFFFTQTPMLFSWLIMHWTIDSRRTTGPNSPKFVSPLVSAGDNIKLMFIRGKVEWQTDAWIRVGFLHICKQDLSQLEKAVQITHITHLLIWPCLVPMPHPHHLSSKIVFGKLFWWIICGRIYTIINLVLKFVSEFDNRF